MKKKTKSTIAVAIFALISLYSVAGLIAVIPSVVSAGIDSAILIIASKIFCLFPAIMSIVFTVKNQPKKIAKFRFLVIFAIGTYIPFSGSTQVDPVNSGIAIASVVLFLIALFKFAPGPKMYLKHVLGGEESKAYDEDTEEE